MRPSLRELLSSPTDTAIACAYEDYGYTLVEIAFHLGVHYATLSRRLRRHEALLSQCKT